MVLSGAVCPGEEIIVAVPESGGVLDTVSTGGCLRSDQLTLRLCGDCDQRNEKHGTAPHPAAHGDNAKLISSLEFCN